MRVRYIQAGKTESCHDTNFVVAAGSGGVVTATDSGPSNDKLRVIMMPPLSFLVVPEVVDMTTSGATSDEKVGIMTSRWIQWVCFKSYGIQYTYVLLSIYEYQ